MTDIVARLRDADTTRRIGESYADTHERRQRDRNEAAAEIERLRAALEEYLDADDHLAKVMPECVAEGVIEAAIKRVRAAKKEARAALAQEAP